MANAAYYNMMLHPPSVFKAVKYFLFPNSYKRTNSLVNSKIEDKKIDIAIEAD